jgi:hypothetical protein
VLVKFTAADTNPVSQRWRDLLLAEHLALAVLGVTTSLWDFGSQRFLEVPRFDRIGPLGRVGVFCRALDAEFVGAAHAPWPVVVQRLVAAGHVTPQSHAGAALLWAFGTLIGNTDMHAGNLPLSACMAAPTSWPRPTTCCPWALPPRSGGALVDTLAPAMLIAEVDASYWRQALLLRRISTPVCARMTVSLPALPPALPRGAAYRHGCRAHCTHGLSRSRTDSGKRLHLIMPSMRKPRNIHVTLILKSRPIPRQQGGLRMYT